MGNALLLQAMMAAIAKIAATEVGPQTIQIFKQQYAERSTQVQEQGTMRQVARTSQMSSQLMGLVDWSRERSLFAD